MDVPLPDSPPPRAPPSQSLRGFSTLSAGLSPGARAAIQRVADDVDTARAERASLYTRMTTDATTAAAERHTLHQRMEASLARSQQLHDDLSRDAAAARSEREALRQQQQDAAAVADAALAYIHSAANVKEWQHVEAVLQCLLGSEGKEDISLKV